ncbi:MAG: M48 family metallopeptidase [Dehalococcoidia bacterium]|nr:M48 family metallopeptidase [Dehalococcoidia bacterium]
MFMKRRPTRQLTIIGQQHIVLQGQNVNYILKQSALIKGIRLEIHNDTGLIVVVPARYRPEQINNMLGKKADWILRHLPVTKPMQVPLFRKEIDHGEKIRYMDSVIEVHISRDGHKRPVAFLKGNKLIISGSAEINSRARVLENWYRQQAARVFKEKADRFKIEMGLDYNNIVIRGQRKRWASASHQGNLSINWKLLLAPEEVVDYVIMHELAHFKHMDHSRRFWDYLSDFCPNWREHRKWLGKHEDELKTASTFSR